MVARWRDSDAAATLEATVGEGEPVQRLQAIHPDEASARAAARAELRRGQRGEQNLDITLPGDTRLMAEGRLSLSGFREGADGEWLIEEVPRYDPEGYCDSITDSTSLYNHCVKREQESYNALRTSWSNATPSAREYCGDLVDNYRLLEHCIKREMEAESQKGGFSFD